MSDSAPLVEELVPAPDLLDSATHPDQVGRHTFLTADPATVVRSKGALTQQLDAGRWTRIAADPVAHVGALLEPFAAEPVAGIPPFQGGAAGYVGYDWGAQLERVPRTRYDDLAIPDAMLGLYDWVIAWDHQTEQAWVISTGIPEQGPARRERAARRLAFVKERLADRRIGGSADSEGTTSVPAVYPPIRLSAPSYPVPDVPGVRSNFTRAGRLQAPLAGTPFELYRRLRQRNPAPFAAYLDFGDVVVASSSPERFLRVDDGRRVETRPIKGTRPRGVGPEHDAALALALAESDKDMAENVMIVDLLRNDLSRVCRPGTVRVPELFALEHYQTVHHLVSTVVGELAPQRDGLDLLRAAFPGGSITGAPKVRAMQIIAELEPTQRAVYCGSIGYVSVTGALDTSIVIRTYLVIGRDVYFQVGGGIVADSDPAQEYRETLDKARGLIAALEP